MLKIHQDLKQEKDALLHLNEVLRRKAGGLFRISRELRSCGKGWLEKPTGPQVQEVEKIFEGRLIPSFFISKS